jgi:photoactive yellow protein
VDHGFTDLALLQQLEGVDDAELDWFPLGVIAITTDGVFAGYNAAEGRLEGLSRANDISRLLLLAVAPCTRNFMVAQRFETEPVFGSIIDYVFTLRMQTASVQFRLLRQLASRRMYLAVQRR